MKNIIKFIKKHSQKIKILISSLIMIFILSKINFEDFAKSFKYLNPFLFIIFLISNMLSIVFAAFKWNEALRIKNINISFKKILSFTWIGTFYSNILPGRITGDAVKIYLVSKNTKENKIMGGTSVIIDRIANMPVMIIIALTISLPYFGVNIFYLAATYLFFIMIIIFLIMIKKSKTKISPFFSRFLSEKVLDKITDFIDSFYKYFSEPSKIFYIIFLGLVFQVITIFNHFLLGLSMGFTVSFFYYVLFLPIFLIISIFPISFSGWGIREVTFIFFLTQVGISKESALSFSILIYTSFLVTSLPGYFYTLKSSLKDSWAHSKQDK